MAKTKTKEREPALFEEGAAAQEQLEKEIKLTGGEVVADAQSPARPARSRATVRRQEVARVEPRAAVPAPPAPLAMLQTIERLATNKDTNPEIVKMLLDEMRALRAEQARATFDDHLSLMQGELPIVERRGKITVRAKDAKGERTGAVQQSTPYALYEDLIEEVLPIMSRHGFSISHVTDTEDKVRVESILSGHGFERRTKLTLMHDSTGSKNSVQAVVSSVSYAKRINLCALISVATRGEDDDAASAGGPAVLGDPLSAEQTEQLFNLCEAIGVDRGKLLELMNKTRPRGHPEAKEIGQLPALRFEEAIGELRAVEDWNKKQKEKS